VLALMPVAEKSSRESKKFAQCYFQKVKIPDQADKLPNQLPGG
jgi:general L-amino acid transport system ATP-binding protein